MTQAGGASTWMRGTSTPLRGALLGLLLERPGHGGDLASRVASRLGETWRIDKNDVYRLLDKLEAEGLASSYEEARRENPRRSRLVYAPTERSAAALACWMETLIPREPVRLGLQAKLAVAREEDARRLSLALREHERECSALADLVSPSGEEPGSWVTLRMECTRDLLYRTLQAEIDWARDSRQRIEKYAAIAV
jgi:DNA-binding PadR family transcriptional regulator